MNTDRHLTKARAAWIRLRQYWEYSGPILVLGGLLLYHTTSCEQKSKNDLRPAVEEEAREYAEVLGINHSALICENPKDRDTYVTCTLKTSQGLREIECSTRGCHSKDVQDR